MKSKKIRKIGSGFAAAALATALVVPAFFNTTTYVAPAEAEEVAGTQYATAAELLTAQEAFNKQVVQEGTVLLKNNNALPLAANAKVTTFHSYYNPEGWGQSVGWTPISGAGSGNIWVQGKDRTDRETVMESSGCYTIYDGFKASGLDYNADMVSAYSSNPGFCDVNGPKMEIVTAQESSFAAYGDAAIITIARLETESRDEYEPEQNNKPLYVRDPQHPEKHYLQLRDSEKELIEYAKTKFGKVIVLLNTAMPIEIDYLKTSNNVDAVLWVGYPGEAGWVGVTDVLAGKASPSGKLVDTWAKDLTKDPTYFNFGDNSQVTEGLEAANLVLDKNGNVVYDEDGETPLFYSVDYEENIYVGYRYYETKATIMNEAEAGSGDAWFNANVSYPFGYGLSYTTFTQTIKAHDESGDKISLTVEVTNTGEVAGKNVVQVYYNPPYTNGGIEKASANLVAFAKTEVLAPGAKQEILISFDKRDMASWDLNAGNYILEDGNYEISVKSDSHNELAKITYTHAADTVYDKDGKTQTAYTKLFSGNDMYNVDKSHYSADGKGVDFMSRATGLQLPTAGTSTKFSDEAIAYLKAQNTYVSSQDKADDPWVIDAKIPDNWTQAAKNSDEGAARDLATMVGVELGDPAWDEFMNGLTWNEMVNLVKSAKYKTMGLARVNKPITYDTDGPAQLGAVAGGRGYGHCAAVNISSSWNTELAKRFGELVGEEANNPETNNGVLITGWYGPGMNIHRSPFCGRNFEYYSEDGILAGKIAAGAVKGAASRGLVTYLKHLALNNQETNRSSGGGVCTWTNEQAMRELYLKPFEIAVKEGEATGMMCAFNRIGGVPAGANYNLFVKLLEQEWGYTGLSVTDYYEGSSWGWPGNMVVRCHMIPMGDYSVEAKNRQIDGTWNAAQNRPLVGGAPQDALYYAVRTTAMRVIYNTLNSNAFQKVTGADVTKAFADKTVNVVKGETGTVQVGSMMLVSGVDTVTITGGDAVKVNADGELVYSFSEVGTYEYTAMVTLNSKNRWGEGNLKTMQTKITFNVTGEAGGNTQPGTEDGNGGNGGDNGSGGCGGCNGMIGATSAVIAGLAVLGGAALVTRKKKDDEE